MINSSALRITGLGIVLVIVELLLLKHLPVFGVHADILLLMLLSKSRYINRTEAILLAAGLGFFQDALFDFWGLNMAAKLLTIFLLHPFLYRKKDSEPLPLQVFVTILAASILHGLMFSFLSSFSDAFSAERFFIEILLVKSLYNSVLGVILFSFFSAGKK